MPGGWGVPASAAGGPTGGAEGVDKFSASLTLRAREVRQHGLGVGWGCRCDERRGWAYSRMSFAWMG